MSAGKDGRGLGSSSGFDGQSHGVPLLLNFMPPVMTPFHSSYKSIIQATRGPKAVVKWGDLEKPELLHGFEGQESNKANW